MAADPAQRTVLFLKANPASTVALDLEAEYQAIANLWDGRRSITLFASSPKAR